MIMIIIISVKGESVAPGFHCSSGRGPTCRSGLTFDSADSSEHCTFYLLFGSMVAWMLMLQNIFKETLSFKVQPHSRNRDESLFAKKEKKSA